MNFQDHLRIEQTANNVIGGALTILSNNSSEAAANLTSAAFILAEARLAAMTLCLPPDDLIDGIGGIRQQAIDRLLAALFTREQRLQP